MQRITTIVAHAGRVMAQGHAEVSVGSWADGHHSNSRGASPSSNSPTVTFPSLPPTPVSPSMKPVQPAPAADHPASGPGSAAGHQVGHEAPSEQQLPPQAPLQSDVLPAPGSQRQPPSKELHAAAAQPAACTTVELPDMDAFAGELQQDAAEQMCPELSCILQHVKPADTAGNATEYMYALLLLYTPVP